MHSIIQIAFVNAAMIIPLAIVAEVAGRSFKRPALTHLLWVVILVKLITPPIWQIPLLDREFVTTTAGQLVPPIFSDISRLADATTFDDEKIRQQLNQFLQKNNDETTIVTKQKPRPRTLADQDKFVAIQKTSPLAILANWIRLESTQQFIISCLIGIWGLGGIIWFGVQGLRCIRFRRSLTDGTVAPPELQSQADELACRLGLTRSPTVWLMPRAMSPMLWGNGHSTRLIFPEQLLDRLDQESTGTLLLHELSHFRRRDHWVRVIALLATGFYWWHPVVWWARREIESAEEECCDALVLKTIGAPPKRYAEAILEAIDFMADLSLRLPPLATGLSQFPFLQQRLTWIMRGPRKQDLSYCGLTLLLFATGVLPVQPTWLAAHVPIPVSEKRQTIRPPRIEFTVSSPLKSKESDQDTPPDTVMIPSVSHPATPTTAHEWPGYDVRSHSYDKRFVFISNSSTQILLDTQTGRDFDLTPYDIVSIAFSPDTYQFATVDGDRFLRMWDAEICDFQTWQIPGGPANSVDVSSGGRWIATGGRDGVVRIWNVANQKPIRELPRELTHVNCVRFSANDELLAVATGDSMSPQSGRIAIFNVGSWTERISMNWNTPAAAVAFNSDSTSLTSGDWKGRIARWSLATGELLGLLDGQREFITAAGFSPNGSPLVGLEIPDLDPNTTWGEPILGKGLGWLLNRQPSFTPAVPSSPTVAPVTPLE